MALRRDIASVVGETGGEGVFSLDLMVVGGGLRNVDEAETAREVGWVKIGEGDEGDTLLRWRAMDSEGRALLDRDKVATGDVLARLAAEAPDVAAWRRVGGAAAVNLAFSLAALIIAELEGFFTGVETADARVTLTPPG